MKNRFKYWSLILMLTIGMTICVQLFFRFFRIAYSEDTYYLGIVESLFSAFFLPTYLLTIFYYANKKFELPRVKKVYAFLFFACILISIRIDFANWWDTSGKNVDAETRDIVKIGLALQFLFGLLVSEIGLLIIGKSLQNQQK